MRLLFGANFESTDQFQTFQFSIKLVRLRTKLSRSANDHLRLVDDVPRFGVDIFNIAALNGRPEFLMSFCLAGFNNL